MAAAPQAAGPPPASRSEQRNAALRATLTPLAPGERPLVIKIASAIAVLIGAGDLVQLLLHGSFDVGGTKSSSPGVVIFALVMLVCAAGMWRLRYWAVLGFQAFLGVVILLFSLLLVKASNLLGLLVALAIIGGGGFLFYKLVRVLSRLQMPRPPG